MRRVNLTIKVAIISFAAVFLYSCGASSALEDKKAELDKKRNDLMALQAEIAQLEDEVATLDTTADASAGNILVTSYGVESTPFVHKIEIRGSVASRKNIMMSAETMGRIERVNVVEGQKVKQGDLMIQIDSDILANNISEIQTQMELAQTVYERQENLWEQNIGTEIQYLQAKNNYESLDRRLATLKSQLNQYFVRAPFDGVVDNIPAKVGEMAQPGVPLIRIVNPNEMYVTADVPEAYLGVLSIGDSVDTNFPVQGLTLNSTILSVGSVLNDQNRTFKIDVALSPQKGYQFKPNQVVRLTLVDYKNESALSVPTNVILSDAGGKFVYTIASKDGKRIAQRTPIKTGQSFDDMTEIVEGLSSGMSVINQGYRSVTNGAEISVSTAAL